MKTNIVLVLLGTLCLVTSMLTGCDGDEQEAEVIEPGEEVVVSDITPMPPGEVVLAHPWLNKEFWASIADDDTSDYNFECAFGLPMVRRDGYAPLLITQSIPNMKNMESHIRRMMWEVCGNMNWSEWRKPQ